MADRGFRDIALDFGLALGGQNQLLQRRQELRRSEQLERQEQQRGRRTELSQGRKAAAAEDFRNIRNLLAGGFRDRALSNIDERLKIGRLLPDFDSSSTDFVRTLIDSGDVASAIEFLDIADQKAVTAGAITARAQAEQFTLRPGEERFRGEERIAGVSPARQQATTDIGKLRQDLDNNLITAADFTGALARISEQSQVDTIGQELERENARLRNRRLQQQIANELAPVLPVERTAETANIRRLNTLAEAAPARQLGIERAGQFLKAFQEGQAVSGAGRRLFSFVPGVFSEQGEFDEALDSFAEFAARAQLKANGEIRPTDADVSGAKKALFGIARDEDTNIRLLEDYLRQQRAVSQEFETLQTARSEGTLGQLIPSPTLEPSRTPGFFGEENEADKEGDTAVNPSTGERIVFRNGQWVAQ